MVNIDEAYKYVHLRPSGGKLNMYYCSENEFLKFKEEKEYRLKFENKFNEIMKYTVINSYTKRLYNEIQNSGYSNKEIYNCLIDKENDIIRALKYRRDIKDEKHRIKYAFAIIRNGMFDITMERRRSEKLNKVNETKSKDVEVVEYKRENTKKHERKGLLDIIGGR